MTYPHRGSGPEGEHTNMHGLSATTDASHVRHMLLDMDGVLFRGHSPLPGAADFLAWLRRGSIPFRLLTNNSTRTPEDNTSALAAMGIKVDPDEIFTSSMATAGYLREHGALGQEIFVIGEEGLTNALRAAGLEVTDAPEAAQWVVAGLDRSVTYAKLRDAACAIQGGAQFVATNADTSLPVERGVVPGAGALQAAIIATTGVKPLVIGKPEPRMLELASRAIGGTVGDTVMVGDRLDTDIEAARRARMLSVLVLTGVTRREELTGGNPITPDIVVDDLAELMRLWDNRSISSRP